ncbi:MAG: sucrose synthase (sucrose-UDP glucosyltransferase), partial [Candidatus Limnocylindrales bacterium]
MTAVRDGSDAVTGIAAVHAIAAIAGRRADHALADALQSGPGPLPAHAAWASAGRAPAAELLEPLVGLLIAGGLAGMHAQAALAQWARTEPWLVAAALRSGLVRVSADIGRRHVVETLGLVPDEGVMPVLASAAADRSESDIVRVAAIAALADRLHAPLPRSILALAGGGDRVADAVRLAKFDRASRRHDFVGGRPSNRIGSNAAAGGGVRVAQVHLGAVLDPDLLRSGVGDTGGIATLLVKLGVALAHTPGIAEVVTIGRGSVRDALDAIDEPGGAIRFAAVPLEPEADVTFGDPWPARIDAQRGLRRALRVYGRPDVIHLRMADVGTLAAATVATTLGIPTVFSLAPDPHGLIASREVS